MLTIRDTTGVYPTCCYTPPNSVTPIGTSLYISTSFRTLFVTYAMMESCTSTEAEHQGGNRVDFVAVLDQVIALLRQRGRLTYRTLQRQFQLDDATLDDLKDELIYGQRLAVDEDSRVLVWTGDAASSVTPVASPPPTLVQPPRWPTRPPILPKKFSAPALPWKANASRSRCSLPISRTPRNSSVVWIPKPPSNSSIPRCTI